MKQGRLVLFVILLASGCVYNTINCQSEAGDAGENIVGCRLGGTSGGLCEAGATPSVDSRVFQPAKATDSITLRGNLNSTAYAQTWNPATPKMTSNFTNSMTIYDSLGKPIQLDLFFCKHNPLLNLPGDSGVWTYHVMTDRLNLALPPDDAPGASAGTDIEIAAGTLRFDLAARLVSNLVTFQSFCPIDAICPQVLTFNFGTGTEAGGNGLDGLTQYAAPFAITDVAQSGSPFIAFP